MTDQNKLDHWNHLAHELGAAPVSKVSEDEPAPAAGHSLAAPEPAAPDPKPPETSPQEPVAESQSPIATWDALASNLGIVPQPHTVEPAAEEQPPEPAVGQAPTEEPSGLDKGGSVSAVERPAQPERASDTKDASEGRPKRNRKRRSSRRKKKSPSNCIDGPDEPAAEEDSSADGPEKRARRPKHPAPKAKKSSKPQDDQPEPAEASVAARTSHRAIPTWEEAVGLIVSANLETRAKSPGGRSAHGRGKGRGSSRTPRKTPGSAKGSESGKKSSRKRG